MLEIRPSRLAGAGAEDMSPLCVPWGLQESPSWIFLNLRSDFPWMGGAGSGVPLLTPPPSFHKIPARSGSVTILGTRGCLPELAILGVLTKRRVLSLRLHRPSELNSWLSTQREEGPYLDSLSGKRAW